MENKDYKNILEALLMSAQSPLSLDKMLQAFSETERPTRQQLQNALNLLSEDYNSRAIELKKLPGGYRLQTKADYQPWIQRHFEEKPQKYSQAFLEILAIIAYRQPVTRADIEAIRGVTVNSAILKGLMEREWVEIAGYRDVVGKPAVYITTKTFLDYFNLTSLNDLPPLQPVINDEQ